MKKYLITLFATCFLSCTFLFAQSKPGEGFKDRSKPEVSKPEGKPDGATGLEKPEDRKPFEKIKLIKEKLAENGDIRRPQRPDKGELSEEVKTQLDGIKEKQEALHSELKESLADLGEDATKEEIKAAAQEFKAANKERFEAIKAQHEAIREELKAARPARPERLQIELSEELKAKVANLKDKREELHQAQKEMLTTLKDASKEERKEIIEQFKEDNKAKHQEIKETAKALKEEIREQVETKATRTSDL
jgi:gas vesicle protein